MLSWLFKKRGATAAPGAKSASAAASIPASVSTSAAGASSVQPAKPAENWQTRLQQALGDDAALLQVATAAAGLDTRLAAVEGLSGEDALRQAERAFRTRDRKVHRLAKTRLETAVSRRESRAKAAQLIALTDTLLQDPLLPVNHVVQLDRDWQALPAALLDASQHDAFAQLRSQLDSAIRQRADAEQRVQQWNAQCRSAVPAWQRAIANALALPPEEARATLTDVRSQAQELRARRPAAASTEALDAALAQLLAEADSARNLVDAAPAPQAEAEAAIDAAPPLAEPVRRPEQDRLASADQSQQLQALLEVADQALADGQLAALQQQLLAVDALQAGAKRTQWPAALRARQQALRAELLRLKGWQSWGGHRAREDLIAQAQALARLTAPVPSRQSTEGAESADSTEHTKDADNKDSVGSEASTAVSHKPKLNLRAHADAIHGLRMRWKALDKLGEGAHGDLWQRFDAALTTAHQPVAEQHVAQQLARQQNLSARQALLDTLDAVPVPVPMPLPDIANAAAAAAANAAAAAADSSFSGWHDAAHQLEAFQLAWRQLGPVQHTAPAAEREPLMQRMQASVERLEQPLRRARERAVAQREQLIQRVQALLQAGQEQAGQLQAGQEQAGQVQAQPVQARQMQARQAGQAGQRGQGGGPSLHGSELQRQLRGVQAEWQDQARRLPLPRQMESALWQRFRAACDAVFAERDATFAAREAEQAAEVSEREAVLLRLVQVDALTTPAHIDSLLAEADRAWNSMATGLPRSVGTALQARYDSARAAGAAVSQRALRVRWQAQIDAWAEPLAAACDDLPTAAVVAAAAAAATAAATATATEDSTPQVDDLLLQLEMALDLPASPEWLAARRQRKLRALKDTMEGRRPTASAQMGAAESLLAVLRQPALNKAQRQRLRTLLAVLREAAPGTLDLPLPTT